MENLNSKLKKILDEDYFNSLKDQHCEDIKKRGVSEQELLFYKVGFSSCFLWIKEELSK